MRRERRPISALNAKRADNSGWERTELIGCTIRNLVVTHVADKVISNWIDMDYMIHLKVNTGEMTSIAPRTNNDYTN